MRASATRRALEASSVPTDAQGKKQQVLEILPLIDKGSSILLAHHVRSDFRAQTALAAVAQTEAPQGLPPSLTLDRDTRLGWEPRKRSDFPAALVRFCHASLSRRAPLRCASPSTKRFCRTLSPHPQSGVLEARAAWRPEMKSAS
jgi:hypothetical protein